MLFGMTVLAWADWQEIFHLDWTGLWTRLGEAAAVRERVSGRRVSFCVIINAKSGACSEDCAFCSQAGKAKTGAPHYPLLPREQLVAAAQEAAAAGAARFSLVTAGRGSPLGPGTRGHHRGRRGH
jgi:biotin synthase-like enzyme